MIVGETIRITGTTIGKANDHDRSQTCQNVFVRPRFIKTTVKETIPVLTMPIKKAKTTLRPRLFLIVDCSCLTLTTRLLPASMIGFNSRLDKLVQGFLR